MDHAARTRHEGSVMTDEQRELERYKQEIARLRRVLVQLSEIVLRNAVEDAKGRKSECA